MGADDDGNVTIRVAKIHDLRRAEGDDGDRGGGGDGAGHGGGAGDLNELVERGRLILVDRLWPRGVAKDAVDLDGWFKDVAPSTELRTWFGHDPAKFGEFTGRYRHELDESDAGELAELVAMAGDATVAKPLVLVYAAKDRDHNHALVLARWLREAAH